jgi:lipopolysaccharide/colanic/teichoic acid biosynthesis glycosyltransferase
VAAGSVVSRSSSDLSVRDAGRRVANMLTWQRFVDDWYRARGKRRVDSTLGGIALLFLCPIMAITVVAVRIAIGSPVLFRQPRPGLHGRIFTMLKFRTMTDARDGSGILLPDELRITWLGRFLRATSLDELPELWNVLRGDMSLIGPRPLLEEYLSYYSAEQRRRHTVRPGLTGLAQINGRNQTTWEERLAWDVYYVDHYGFVLDCKIFARTLATFWRSDGGIEVAKALGKFTGACATAHVLPDEKPGCCGSSPVTVDQRQ